MRIPIREQLLTLLTLAVLVALAIVAVPTWIYVNKLVIQIEETGLALTASLKATRIASQIYLLEQTCVTITSRVVVQHDLLNFYGGVSGSLGFDSAALDLSAALSAAGSITVSFLLRLSALFLSTSSTLPLLTYHSALLLLVPSPWLIFLFAHKNLLQARVYSRNASGGNDPLFQVTSSALPAIQLPYLAPDGLPLFLSNDTDGYPASLYPNLTYIDLDRPNPFDPGTSAFAAQPFPGVNITKTQGLLLGPLIVNESFALLSLTIPIRDSQNQSLVLGYMCVLAEASNFIDILDSREGLGDTGIVLLIGPNTPYNRFVASNPASNGSLPTPNVSQFSLVDTQFVIPPVLLQGQADRHSADYAPGSLARGHYSFPISTYPAVLDAFTQNNVAINNASSMLSTTNEHGIAVAVGYARIATDIVDWLVVIETSRSEAYKPIMTLRDILLATVFGTLGAILLLSFPCAHIGVMPIVRLRDATEKTIQPPGFEGNVYDTDGEDTQASGRLSGRSKKGIVGGFWRVFHRRQKLASGPESGHEHTRRNFKIPGKVDDRKHYVTDELTELTGTFNDMSDELVKQYTRLEDKVAERTRELEISKKAAEAANESKTLFIANISHELKTPLNGILGMCAICMEEPDITRIKQSLKTLYKSGDLLLHLLEDLLSFSKNQIGQQLSLEQREFRLGDIRSQILIIFDKQVREGRINFSVTFTGPDALDHDVGLEQNHNTRSPSPERKVSVVGPQGTGRLRDTCIWGDQHRVLQVIINLVSNSLKFTPPDGKVSLRIRCLGEADLYLEAQSRSTSSQSAYPRSGRARHRISSSNSNNSRVAPTGVSNFRGGTAVAINPLEPRLPPQHHVHVRERSPTPPPSDAKPYMFEFEVEDTGPGIPENMQERVFEPFVQGDLGLSKKFGGTGLGLSICHQLATLMGGSITLRSTVGVGTTFTMRIPLKYVKDSAKLPTSFPPVSPHQAHSILGEKIGHRSYADCFPPSYRASSAASGSIRSRRSDVGTMANKELASTQIISNHATSNESQPNRTVDPQPRLVGLSLPFFASNPIAAKPAATEDQLATLESAKAKKEGKGRIRVLVADDNSTNIEVVSRMLVLEDIFDVTIAKDGQQAFDHVKAAMSKNQRFDVIFMDIQMPNLDGLQSTRLIRQMGYKSPIVALTAFSEESNVKECLESGMNEFLSKPIRRPALKKVLMKFATIKEEVETAVPVTKTTLDDGVRATDAAAPSAPIPSVPLTVDSILPRPQEPLQSDGSVI